MEKYYKVDNEDIKQRYLEWKENFSKYDKAFDIIKNEIGLETTRYYPRSDIFMIETTNQDEQKFSKSIKNDRRTFKKSSKENKRWLNIMLELEIKSMRKVNVDDYLYLYNRYSQNMFIIDDIMYAYFKSEYDLQQSELDKLVGWQEIKGSEYHKVIEDYKSRVEVI